MNPINRVTLVEIDDIKTAENGNPYVLARFKNGVFGRTVSRTFWGQKDDNGKVTWQRATPADLKALVGQNVSGQVFVEAVDVEPKEITGNDGKVRTITTAAVVRFADETVEAACQRYGLTLREKSEADHQTPALLPSGFVVAANGNLQRSADQ